MCSSRARVGLRDLLEEPQELLVPVPGVAGVGDLAGGDLQRGEQRGGAVPDVVVGAPSPAGRAAAAASARSGPAPGSGTSRPRTAPRPCPAGSGTGPTTSRTLASSCGSVENLNVSARHGCSPHSRHTPATLTLEMPSSAASSRDDQCVTPSRSGGGSSVASTIATSSVVRGLPGFGRSSSPPIPSAAYRFFHAITVGLDTPVRRTISFVPEPVRRPAARSGPAAPARPGSTATAPTRPAPHDRAAEPPPPQSTP